MQINGPACAVQEGRREIPPWLLEDECCRRLRALVAVVPNTFAVAYYGSDEGEPGRESGRNCT